MFPSCVETKIYSVDMSLRSPLCCDMIDPFALARLASLVIEAKIIQLDLFKIEMFKLNSLIDRLFEMLYLVS